MENLMGATPQCSHSKGVGDQPVLQENHALERESMHRTARPKVHAVSVWVSHVAVVTLLTNLVLLVASPRALHAQGNAEDPSNGRKLLHRVEPEYPPDLKRAGIGGYVHLQASISPSGNVEEATIAIAGGNPILAEASIKALRQWKYAPAESRTPVQLWFRFSPQSPPTSGQ
jgi:TonB family protein